MRNLKLCVRIAYVLQGTALLKSTLNAWYFMEGGLPTLPKAKTHREAVGPNCDVA